jgi:hypothetical protein
MKFTARHLLPLLAACALVNPAAQAGKQEKELLAASVRASLHQAVSDAPPVIAIEDRAEHDRWLAEMSDRLKKRIPDPTARKELLTTIHYEATRAGLDPQLVLGLIHVESRFRKYALSKAGARGYMQVMPFWVEAIGNREDNLFHMRTNLRYGCTILRHYLDLEKGNLFLALGRYNGSRGKSEYPDRVHAAWQNLWAWTPAPVQTVARSPSSVPASPASVKAPPPASSPPIAAMLIPKPSPPAPQTPAPASTPPTLPKPVAAAPSPAPKPRDASPAPRMSARRDIVIVR